MYLSINIPGYFVLYAKEYVEQPKYQKEIEPSQTSESWQRSQI